MYSKRYFNRHLIQYRLWENAVGRSIVRNLSPASIIDLGCGVGSYLEGALNAGCTDIQGIEKSYNEAKHYMVKQNASSIQCGDVTIDLELNRTFDCVLSFEVAEHIVPNGTDQFIENLITLSNKHIILTAAPPGQGGTGHINLRKKEFWKEQIESKGFCYKDDLVERFISEWRRINEPRPKEKFELGDYGMRGAGETSSYVPKYILRNLMVFSKE